MAKQQHIIYVPGILDDIYHVQGVLVAAWRLRGVHGHIHPIPWAGNELWEPKFQRLLRQIDDLAQHGHNIALVGASAGASAVLNAYVERADKINSLVYICSKINAPETVGKQTYQNNPAFKTSLLQLQPNLPKLSSTDKAKMLSLYSTADKTVPYPATVIPDIEEQRLPRLRHAEAILYSLSFGAPKLMKHIKRG